MSARRKWSGIENHFYWSSAIQTNMIDNFRLLSPVVLKACREHPKSKNDHNPPIHCTSPVQQKDSNMRAPLLITATNAGNGRTHCCHSPCPLMSQEHFRNSLPSSRVIQWGHYNYPLAIATGYYKRREKKQSVRLTCTTQSRGRLRDKGHMGQWKLSEQKMSFLHCFNEMVFFLSSWGYLFCTLAVHHAENGG